jgi:hypothetical protein
VKLTAAEIRDWTAFALSGLGLYLSWPWRPRRKQGRHIVLEFHDSVKLSDEVMAIGPGGIVRTLGVAQETDTALLVKAIGGVPS